MKRSAVTLHELGDFLKKLGFHEIPEGKPRMRFDHPCGSVLLYRVYKHNEKMAARDMVVTGIQLVEHGLVKPSDFERFEHKTPA